LQSGRESGRLAYVTGYDSSGRMVGVDGYSYPAVLDNFDGTTICAGIGVRGNVTPPTVLTLDATGTYWIGGVYGAVNGAINTTPANGAVAGVIGVDNNSGTATSYAGYFDGDVNITGSLTGADVHIGSGASGYITKWTGAYSQGNSQIYDNGSNVGIGTSSPSTKLHVQTSGGGEIARFSSYSYSGPTAIIGTENTAPGLGYLGLYYATESTPRVKITAHASNPSYFNGGGNVGIGTTTPSQKLDVNGYVDMANGYAIGASATNIKITYGRITYGNLSNNARYWATIPHGLSNAYQVLASLYNCADGSSQVHPAGVSVSVFRSGGSGAWSYCIENKSGGTRNISITWMAIGAP
ncbi:hypothetical protein KAH81_02190, partial [bacterium]|nr:hypothetical protein [bacterium]